MKIEILTDYIIYYNDTLYFLDNKMYLFLIFQLILRQVVKIVNNYCMFYSQK